MVTVPAAAMFEELGQDMGEFYKIASDTKYYQIDSLHKSEDEEMECDQLKLKLTSEEQSQVPNCSFGLIHLSGWRDLVS